MKKYFALLFIIVLLISACTVPVRASQNDVQTTAAEYNGCSSLDAVNAVLGSEQLIKNASSIILFERNSQTMMYQWNADEQTDPSELTKIMTAYVVIQEADLADVVTVREETLDTIGSGADTVDLQPEEVLTVEQLLYCMLVSSANDAAAVLADHVSGSQEAFVELMNSYAKELGCTNTNFVNPHGLRAEGQYASARDLARILNTAMEDEVFRDAFGDVTYSVPVTNKSDYRDISTGNYLMSVENIQVYYDERVIGAHDGITSAGLRCIASAARSGNMELICIVMGSASTFADNGYVKTYGAYQETIDLYSMGLNGMHLTQVIREDQVVTQRKVTNGDCDVILGPTESAYAILPDSITAADLMYRFTELDSLEAPIEKGDIVSTVEIWRDNICVAQAELYAMNSVKLQQQTVVDSSRESGGSLILTILVVAGCVVVLLLAVREVSRTVRYRSKNRGRQYRRNRQRSR